jgi:hypothetical protein
MVEILLRQCDDCGFERHYGSERVGKADIKFHHFCLSEMEQFVLQALNEGKITFSEFKQMLKIREKISYTKHDWVEKTSDIP